MHRHIRRASKEAQKNEGGTQWIKTKTGAYKGVILGSAGNSTGAAHPLNPYRGYFGG